jgi:hypothetical protein
VVASNFPQIVRGIIGELRGWQPSTCCAALQLLEMYSVYVEDWMQQHVYELLPAILHAVSAALSCKESQDQTVVCAYRCCRLMGVFVPAEILWEALQPVIVDDSLACSLREAAIIMMQAYASGVRSIRPSDQCLLWALEVLLRAELADAQQASVKHALVAMLGECIDGASDECLEVHSSDVVNAVLRLQAWPAMDDERLSSRNRHETEHMLRDVAERVCGPGSSVRQLLGRVRDELQGTWSTGGLSVHADVTAVALRRLCEPQGREGG